MKMLDIGIKSLCKITFNLQARTIDRFVSLAGFAYAYEAQKCIDEAARAKLHLDTWLTRRVARGFYQHRPKRRCVLFFNWAQSHTDMLLLTVSDRSGRVRAPWLQALPGLVEAGMSPLTAGASVWGLWSGGAFHRVHDFLDGEPEGLMVADLGGLLGISIATGVSREDYEEIAGDPVQYWDHRPIPESCCETVELDDGSSAVVWHVGYRGEHDRIA